MDDNPIVPHILTVAERLAVVETISVQTRSDVSEIKSDVKALLESKNKIWGMGTFLTRTVAFLAMVFAGSSLAITLITRGLAL